MTTKPNKAVWMVSKFIADCKKHHRILKEIHLRTDLWEQFKEFARRDHEKRSGEELHIENEVEFSGILIKDSKLVMGQPFYPYFNEIPYYQA